MSIWRMASSGLSCSPSVPAPQGCRSPHYSCAASPDLFPTGLLCHNCFKVNPIQIELPTRSHTPSSPIYAATRPKGQEIACTTQPWLVFPAALKAGCSDLRTQIERSTLWSFYNEMAANGACLLAETVESYRGNNLQSGELGYNMISSFH